MKLVFICSFCYFFLKGKLPLRLQLLEGRTFWRVATFGRVNIRKWLLNPASFKGTNKVHKIYLGRSTTVHNLLFCPHTLWLNYVTVTFVLVSSSDTNHDLLCFVHGQGQKSEEKH